MKLRFKILIAGFIAITLGFFLAKSKFMVTVPDKTTELSNVSETSPKARWVAKVGEEKIWPDDLDWEVSLHTLFPKVSEEFAPEKQASDKGVPLPTSLEGEVQSSEALRQRLLVTIVERKILYQWIKNYSEGFDFDNPSRFIDCLSEFNKTIKESPDGFARPKSAERLKAKLCEQSLVNQYVSEKIVKDVKISEADIKAHYLKNISKYHSQARVVFRQIFVSEEAEAKAIAAKVNRANFSELAKKHSTAPEAANGGLVGPLARGQLPSFFNIIFSMKMGQISGIVRSDYGYHIIMPVQILPSSVRGYSEVKQAVLLELKAAIKQDAYQEWLTSAMNVITVQTNTGATSNEQK